MALIKCPECGKEMSDKATACPNCGCPIEEIRKMENASKSIDITPLDTVPSKATVAHCKKCGITLSDKNATYCKKCIKEIHNIHSKYPQPQKFNNTNLAKDYTLKNARTVLIDSILWIVSVIVLLIALLLFSACGLDGFITFLFLTACAYFISPLTKNLPFSLSKLFKIAISFLLFIASVMAYPTSDVDQDSDIEVSTEVISESEVIAKPNTEIESETTLDTETVLKEEEISEIETSEIAIEYETVFDITLVDSWHDYTGKYVRTIFEVGRCYDSYIDSSYNDGYLRIYPNNYMEYDNGEYITVIGKLTGKSGSYIEIQEAHIEDHGNASLNEYNIYKAEYDEQKRIEAEAYEKEFRETCISVSYDELSRYPDTYETTAIKIKVKITDVEPDGIILPGHYEAVISGTSQKLAVYDDRELKEPKLLKGDTVTIYGYGDGLTTIKLQDTSGLFPKTVDKYTIPSVNIKYVDIH